MKVELYLGTGLALEDAASTGSAAEDLGFDGVWAVESASEPFGGLALLSAATRELQLGTGIAVAFARNPMLMAQAAYELHRFSGGRFTLGIGSQVRAHIERRFSQPWSRPAARMREFVQAMRAIWQSWESGSLVRFDGEFYRHTLMTPVTVPALNPLGPPKVLVAAVGEHMTRVAAESDGLVAHPFTSRSYLESVTLPAIASHRPDGGDFEIMLPVMIATGADEQEYRTAVARARAQVGFYASTPSYRSVLAHHGAEDVGVELSRRARDSAWSSLAELIDDTLLETFAVCAAPRDLLPQIHARYGGLVDRVALYNTTPYGAELWAAVLDGRAPEAS